MNTTVTEPMEHWWKPAAFAVLCIKSQVAHSSAFNKAFNATDSLFNSPVCEAVYCFFRSLLALRVNGNYCRTNIETDLQLPIIAIGAAEDNKMKIFEIMTLSTCTAALVDFHGSCSFLFCEDILFYFVKIMKIPVPYRMYSGCQFVSEKYRVNREKHASFFLTDWWKKCWMRDYIELQMLTQMWRQDFGSLLWLTSVCSQLASMVVGQLQ